MAWERMAMGAGGGLLLAWLGLLAALWRARPEENRLVEVIRLLPDLVRLLRRLAADRSLPGGVRGRLWLVLAYLACPIDLVPDVIPVLGYADDAVVVVLALRSVVRRAGLEPVVAAWPGSAAGLRAVLGLARLGPS